MFLNPGFTVMSDLILLGKTIYKYPTSICWRKMIQTALQVETPPPVVGLSFVGAPAVVINSVDYLEDLYITKTQFVTKFYINRLQFYQLMPSTVLMMQTDDPTYAEKRKTLSGAFFKSKLVAMTSIIKQVIMKEVARLQTLSLNNVQLSELTQNLQSRIIVNVSVGTGYSQT